MSSVAQARSEKGQLQGISSNRASKGVSLIEVLISVLVLSIGILGMAGLQMSAKQTNFDALQRSTASGLVQDMVERMRANPGALSDYVADPVVPGTNCTITACGASDFAKWDRWEWKQLLSGASESNRGGLVSPVGCITEASGDATVTITWTGISDIVHLKANTCAGLSANDTSDKRVFEISVFISG